MAEDTQFEARRLWGRLDQQQQLIADLQARVSVQEDRTERFLATLAEHRAEGREQARQVMEHIDHLRKDLQEAQLAQAGARTGLGLGKWLLRTVLGLAMLGVAIWASLRGAGGS